MTTAGNLVFQGNHARCSPPSAPTPASKLWTTETQAQITGGSASYESTASSMSPSVAGGQAGFGTGSYWAPNYCAPAGLQARRQGRAAQARALRPAGAQSAAGIRRRRLSWRRARSSTPRIAPAATATTPPTVVRSAACSRTCATRASCGRRMASRRWSSAAPCSRTAWCPLPRCSRRRMPKTSVRTWSTRRRLPRTRRPRLRVRSGPAARRLLVAAHRLFRVAPQRRAVRRSRPCISEGEAPGLASQAPVAAGRDQRGRHLAR